MLISSLVHFKNNMSVIKTPQCHRRVNLAEVNFDCGHLTPKNMYFIVISQTQVSVEHKVEKVSTFTLHV